MHVCLFFFLQFFHTFLIPFWFNSNFTKKKFVRLEFGECDDYVDNMPAGNGSTFRITECRTRTSKPLNLYYIINFIERVNHFQTLQICRNEDPFFSTKKNLSEIMFAFMDLFVNCMSIARRWNAKRKRNLRLSFQVPLTTEKVLIELVATRFWCINTDTY